MYDKLLETMDVVEMSQLDAEISVLESLIESYDKSIMILENSDDTTDLSAFDVFQEGEKWDKFKEDANAPILGNKDESIAKRIAMFIPRLIAAIIRLCKKLFQKNKKITQKMEADVAEMKQDIQQSSKVSTSATQETPPAKQPEPVENKDTTEDEINQSLANLQKNAPATRSSSGDVYKSIQSILFTHDSTGDFDRVFLEGGWFDNCKSKIQDAFNAGTDNATALQKHLDTITALVKNLKTPCSELQARYHTGGTSIQIKDSEFVAKMEQFEKMNKDDIDACNELILFVQENIQKLQNIKKPEEQTDESQLISKILRQYNRFLKMLNTYVTTIWQAWEHDKGARDQARIIST